MPTTGDLGAGYKSGFVKNTSNEIYSAKHFDDDSNVDSPEAVKQTNVNKLGYYSNVNGDVNIPDAQGFPYSRTRYLNDGTGRVMESSAAGLKHSIGHEADGRGRTVKTLYGAVSEAELVRVFGNEAPNHESVSKNVTIDQNNVATISYVNKEGQTIATCMSVYDNDLGNLEALSDVITPKSITDIADKSLYIDGEYVSSKRVVLLQEENNFSITYKINCNQEDLPCVSGEVDCGLTVDIKLHNLEDGTTIALTAGGETEVSIDPTKYTCSNGIGRN